ncbi:hypothetical protein BDB00DRAFT_851799 [Zychaea mexicana]|uniref:uncharacterized protein n=1 Tax=Zychaea mexicana TaxID=64656 RepID=UPI0022FEBA8B|nr:uncharacterized protein BDB00DRAFT_851799 [Zychaea mexicana]KAI9485009.1 hypothetical protein BDB00DRAFT_851799 [Zychaea mexicana]
MEGFYRSIPEPLRAMSLKSPWGYKGGRRVEREGNALMMGSESPVQQQRERAIPVYTLFCSTLFPFFYLFIFFYIISFLLGFPLISFSSSYLPCFLLCSSYSDFFFFYLLTLLVDMAPIIHGQHESRLSFHGNNLWTELWADIINAILPIPTQSTMSGPRSRKMIHNRIEPLDSGVLVHHHNHNHMQQECMFDESSKFQTEYVSFPRLAEEDLIQGGEDDDQEERGGGRGLNERSAIQSQTSNNIMNASRTQRPRQEELQEQQKRTVVNTITQSQISDGGSRRSLLGSSWMF